MRFALYDHAGKGAYLRQQLLAAGNEPSDRIDATDLLILDCDWRWAHPRPEMIAAAVGAGMKVALYPHGGMPTVFVYDGLTDPDGRVAVRLEHGPGSVEMAARFGRDDLRQQTVGWLYCPTAALKPGEPGTVLFAPMHPNIEAMQNGTNGHDPAPALNQRVYRELLDTGHPLVVSVVGPAYRSGVWPHPRARIVENHTMDFRASYELVRTADSVVGAGTMAAAAVALGKPTVMLGQGDFSDYVDGSYVEAAHADLYREMARYPLDCADGHVGDLLARACGGDLAAAGWREAFVGNDGTDAAVRVLENLCGQLSEEANYEHNEGGAMREEPTPEPEPEPEGDEGDEGKPENVTIQGVTAKAGAVA